MQSQRIRIRLKAFDYRVLDQSTTEIVDTAKRTGARLAGPVPVGPARGREGPDGLYLPVRHSCMLAFDCNIKGTPLLPVSTDG